MPYLWFVHRPHIRACPQHTYQRLFTGQEPRLVHRQPTTAFPQATNRTAPNLWKVFADTGNWRQDEIKISNHHQYRIHHWDNFAENFKNGLSWLLKVNKYRKKKSVGLQICIHYMPYIIQLKLVLMRIKIKARHYSCNEYRLISDYAN